MAVPGGHTGQHVRGRRMERGGVVHDRHDQPVAAQHAHRRHDPGRGISRPRQRTRAPVGRREHAAHGNPAGRADRCRARPQAREPQDRAHPHRLGHGDAERDADARQCPGRSRRRRGRHPPRPVRGATHHGAGNIAGRNASSGNSARSNAGAGSVTAGGHLEWRELLPYGKFHLQGTNLRVADVPEAQIDTSPDLDFNVSGRRIEVTGKVTVPYAKIQPKDFAGAVRASPDEVIVGSEEEDPTKRFEAMSTITLGLGDRVSIDTSGLTGRLIGSITIRSGYDAITRATGELSVAEGKYTAYARKLDIQRGRLIFTGGPIDNPGIDLRAIKEFPDVKAGVNVRGTLLQPHMTFFSDPPLPQSQVVSLILAGGSLESAQNRTTGSSGAGSAALAQGGAILAQQLGSHVGIEDVSLESDITNETSLVLGRYLSPRLYVSYGISLTQQLNTLKLRYTLGDHWTVKTEAGQASGADLVYSIEK